MHFAEFLIIYLAYGAPFGVYDLSRRRKKPTVGELHLVAAKFIFWPLILASWTRKRVLRVRRPMLRHLEIEIDRLREDLEKIAFGDASAALVLRFREVYARYTGLTLFSLVSRVDSQHRHPLFEFHRDPETRAAAACLHRRDREKVAFHQQQARTAFLDVIGQLSAGQPDRSGLVFRAVEVATLLDDPECANELYSLLPDDKGTRIRTSLTFPKAAN